MQPKQSPAVFDTVSLDAYPSLDSLREFSKRDEGYIKIMVYGSVRQQGIYYLPPQAVVRDAFQSAAGVIEKPVAMACILRPIGGDKAERIVFSRGIKWKDSNVPLKEGDRVYILPISYSY